MDYVASLIYDEDERQRRRDELQHLTLRRMSRREVQAAAEGADRRAGIRIRNLAHFAKSVLSVRHMDTAEYDCHARPMRKALDSLHERNLRTDPRRPLINYQPEEDFEFLNDYVEHIQENVIECRLGDAPPNLVVNRRQGRGCALGLVGIFEADKG